MSLETLLNQVEIGRTQYLKECEGLSSPQSQFKPSPDVWSITDNTEHLYWAEFGGINGMWKAIEGKKTDHPVWTKAATHEGLSIEEIVELTWKPKEDVPLGAEPRIGGTLEFWTSSLKSCSVLLNDLYNELKTHDHLEKIIYPHPISGPLNVIQRFEFLRFHMERHTEQIKNLKVHSDFPKG
ncbi:DinB family protein [Flavobacteriaceae bacterium MAR_2010_72]|nr:DinB family protein [Flavobacteriaceae bacterium MAR_2010_72]